MNGSIAEIPDYAALKKLAAALWQQDNSYNGAAIIVGAGFSRIAASSGDTNSKLPLWADISKLLANEIGSKSQTDSLRLAEEYRAYFGQQALLDVLKRAIHDEAWVPGVLHKDLLGFPWSEVLTTNWDTLLERASQEVHQPVYSIVNRQEDLSNARSPRIVKLHGTIGVTSELIFTQEDFRTYPQNHAAFVNFARQVFIENELCLLGFSGDDPNFLQWAGWVRDHLANHARRIYLVGALSLTAAKRKYLESINVAPIDLTTLVSNYDDADAKHSEATKIFIEALKGLKPKQAWEWEPARLHRTTLTEDESNKTNRDPAHAARLLEEQVAALEANRIAYPGWLSCPPSLLFSLQSQICDPYPNVKNLAAMAPGSREKILYEIAWRHEATYEPVPTWIAHELLAVCDPDRPCAITKRQQMEVALVLLKNSRWMDEQESQSIALATTSILERNAKYWPDCANELAYHRGIIARDNFDYSGLENALSKLETDDPIWKLRKASLLAELGRFTDGKDLIAEAYRELLDQHRKDRNSIHVFSRLAWAHWLMRGANYWELDREFAAFPSVYDDRKCSPLGQIEHIQKRIATAVEKQRESQGIEPLFEPGSYKDNTRTVTFNGELHPLLLLEGLSRTVGMPLRWNGVSFLAESAAKLTEMDNLVETHRFVLAIRSANSDSSDTLKKVFSRIRIACLSSESVTWLLIRCSGAIDYWTPRLTGGSEDVRRFAIERLRVFIEVLARISVRVTPKQAEEIFKKGISLGKMPELQHIWLIDSLRDLLENAIKSIPKSNQQELLSEALSFPLQIETKLNDHFDRWPNPIVKSPGRRGRNAALDRRIDEIIDLIFPPQSAPALLRLLPLLEAGFLTEEERKRVGEKIWGVEPDYLALPQTGLYPHALLVLPAPDSDAATDAVIRYLFDADEERLFDQAHLVSLASASNLKTNLVYPSEHQAEAIFEKLVSWRTAAGTRDPFELAEQRERRTGELIGNALAYAVVPAMNTAALNHQNFDKLLAFHEWNDSPGSIIALAHFAACDEIFGEKVERLVRLGMQGKNANKVASSAHALLKWREAKIVPATDRLTSRLVYLLGASLSSGLHALLWTARQMYDKGYLSEIDAEALADSLPAVFDNANYLNVDPSSREAVSISLVRVECVKLAKSILRGRQEAKGELLRILEEARLDSLPEVRLAESSDD